MWMAVRLYIVHVILLYVVYIVIYDLSELFLVVTALLLFPTIRDIFWNVCEVWES